MHLENIASYGRRRARRHCFASLLVLLLVPLDAVSAVLSRESLTIQEAMAVAFAENPEFAAARWEADIAKGLIIQAASLPNPELSVSVEDTRRESSLTSVELTQPIELGGKRRARTAFAERDRDAALIETEQKINELRSAVIHAFYSALRAQEAFELSGKAVELATRGVAVARGRVTAGKASPMEATRAQLELSDIQLKMESARFELENAYSMLALVGGQGAPFFKSVEGSFEALPALPASEIILSRVEGVPEVRLARMNILRAEANVGVEKAERIPTVSLSVGSQYDRALGQRVNLVGVSVPLPLFNRNRGALLSAARGADQARDIGQAAELRMRTEVRRTLEQWEYAKREVHSLNTRLLPDSENALEGAVRGFEMGKFALIDVLDAQRTFFAVQSRYMDALGRAIDAWVKLEKIYGVELGVELDAEFDR